ncbi:hypothetical protein AB7179_18600 [Providencia manganoxydans]|uniref:hypothetical protein n=1 Tax=Providencia manganoxydans TaxID=2923283 RepID=UPI0034E5CCF7
MLFNKLVELSTFNPQPKTLSQVVYVNHIVLSAASNAIGLRSNPILSFALNAAQ